MDIDLNYFYQLIKSYDYKTLSLYCNKEISSLPKIFEIVKNDCKSDENISLLAFNVDIEIIDIKFILQLWLFSVLNNPFDFTKILDLDTKHILFDFVTKNLIREKLTLKILIRIFTLEELVGFKQFNQWEILFEYSRIYKLDKKLLDFIIYSLNRKVSGNLQKKEINIENSNIEKCVSQLNLQNDENIYFKIDNNCTENGFEKIKNLLNDDDNVTSLIFKFKILSFQYKFYKINLNIFLSYLNYNNFKFGYSLSRSILRIVKYFDLNLFCSYITNQLNNIFANEMLWINSLHILGSLIFQNKNINIKNTIIETAINYNHDYTNYRSALVREYSLFLIYCLFRSNIKSDYLINLTISKLMLDHNYKIRYIAAAILSDFFKIKLEYKRHTDILNSFNKLNKIYKINIFDFIKKEKEIFTIKIQNDLIWKFDLESPVNYHLLENILDFINTGYYIHYCFKYNKIKNTNEQLINNFFKVDLSKFYKFRLIDNLVEIYLKNLYQLKIYNHDTIKNIKFLITKNVNNDLIFQIIWNMENLEIYEFIYKLRKRNNKIVIIANIKNKKYNREIINFYKDYIQKQENIEFTINIYKSIKYLENILVFKDEIYKGLENYYVGSRGDISFEIRLECLELVEKFDIETYEKYFIRFLVDKNKYIRDFLENKIKRDEVKINYIKEDLIFEKIIKCPENYDGKNVCIGLLGYLCTSDNYNFDIYLNIFIEKITFYDIYIKEIILMKYERVYDYIFKLVIMLFERGQRKYIFEWIELLKNHDIIKYKFIKDL